MSNDINKAITEARAFEKAQTMETEGYTVSVDSEAELTYIMKPGDLHFSYVIYHTANNITEKAGCTCPAREKAHTCKHEIFAKMMADKQAEEEAENSEEFWQQVAERNGVTW